MLIEFVKNPQFQPPALAIRVGSVVSFSGWKKGVVTKFQSNTAVSVRPKLEHVYYEELSGLTPLPLRVSGITADGEWEYAPIELPPQEFTWEQYPPRAGMVVELRNDEDEDRFRYLVDDDKSFFAINGKQKIMLRNSDAGNVRAQYRPRPDLMPRFVTEGKR